jgi:hypothetical protein
MPYFISLAGKPLHKRGSGQLCITGLCSSSRWFVYLQRMLLLGYYRQGHGVVVINTSLTDKPLHKRERSGQFCLAVFVSVTSLFSSRHIALRLWCAMACAPQPSRYLRQRYKYFNTQYPLYTRRLRYNLHNGHYTIIKANTARN